MTFKKVSSLFAITLACSAVGCAAAADGSGTERVGQSSDPLHCGDSTTRFFTPAPDSGALEQVADLVRSRDLKDAALVTKMITTPQAVSRVAARPRSETSVAVPTQRSFMVEGFRLDSDSLTLR